jgi:hypothetical protein
VREVKRKKEKGKDRLEILCIAFFLFTFAFLVSPPRAGAQSSDQNFPTPLTTNDVDGIIKARDMGDPRATTYFYAFDGGQGDIFINVVTKNFSGDIDIFSAQTMTPLAKMVIYPESGASETGRLIYLRKPDRLIMRVEGRTPNDDPATFKIKFGGSFIALAAEREVKAPTVAKANPNEPGIKVDSVGRIVAIVPKPTAVSPQPSAKTEPTPGRNASVNERAPTKSPTAKVTNPPSKKPAEKGTVFENDTAKVTVVPPPEPKKTEPPAAPGRNASVKERAAKVPPRKPEPKKAEPKRPADQTTAASPDTQAGSPRSDKPADALASIRLVIQMKDGTTFWMPMSEVLRFTVDKGIMTVIRKDGSVTHYNILDVEKTTIQ